MKKIFTVSLLCLAMISVAAQDNKPAVGSIGIGYGVALMPFAQNISITGIVTKNIEIGGSLGVSFNRTSNSTYDSGTVVGTGFTILPSQTQNQTVTSSTTFFIAPLFLYHFNIKSNLDLGLGANVPIGVTTATKTVQSAITTADNYNSTTSMTTTGPATVSAGLGLLVACKYFFYKGLALGATANIGFSESTGNGNNTTVDATSNSGSNNPSTFNGSTTTYAKVGANSQAFNLLRDFSLSLTWYIGTKKSSTATN